jgi:hypothetical protein
MHYALMFALLCGFLGLVVALASLGAHSARRRLVGAVSAGSLAVVCVTIIGALALAPRQVCEALGGGWDGPTSSCRHELGARDKVPRGPGLP